MSFNVHVLGRAIGLETLSLIDMHQFHGEVGVGDISWRLGYSRNRLLLWFPTIRNLLWGYFPDALMRRHCKSFYVDVGTEVQFSPNAYDRYRCRIPSKTVA